MGCSISNTQMSLAGQCRLLATLLLHVMWQHAWDKCVKYLLLAWQLQTIDKQGPLLLQLLVERVFQGLKQLWHQQ
jgi:hypothetical protein